MKLICFTIGICLWVALCSSVKAQPSQSPLTLAQQAEQAATQKVMQAFEQLRQKTQELERRDVQAAIDEYQKFYEEEAYRYSGAGMEIASLIARLYYVELQNKARALEIYDWALEQFKGNALWQASWQRLWKEREQIKAGKPLPDVVKLGTPNAANANPTEVKTTPSPLVGGALLKPVQIGSITQAPWQKWNKAAPNTNVALPGMDLPSVKVNAVPSIGESALHQATLTQLKIGALTAAQVWQQGHLSADAVLSWINSKTLRWPDDAGLANALIEQVNQHAPEKLEREALKTLPSENRVRIGDYFSAKQDDRAIEIYQDVMSEPGKNGAVPDWYGPAGARLGAFYEAKGESQKALKIYLRTAEALPADGGYGGNLVLDAARIYKHTGELKKAQELYERVPGYGDGWLTALAYYDEASSFIKAGDFVTAEKIMKRPLKSRRQQTEGLIAQNAWLAKISLQQGKVEDAMRYGRMAVDAAPQSALLPEGAQNLLHTARKIYLQSGGWQQEPIHCDKRQVFIQTNPKYPDRPLYGRLKIVVYGKVTVQATVNSDAIQARVLPSGNGEEDRWDTGVEREVIIEVLNSRLFKTKEQKFTLLLKSVNSNVKATSVEVVVQGNN